MSASDADTGRLPWRDLDDLVRTLAADRSSRLCAHMNGWASPVDAGWLASALLETTGAKVLWPWASAAKNEDVDPAVLARARQSMADRWG